MQFEALQSIYEQPFFELLEEARRIHRQHWPKPEVQLCTLLSIKTGGCSEDCSYCAQSAHYSTPVERETLLPKETVLEHARAAKAKGATRFCMGAAWKGVKEGDRKLEHVLDIVREVDQMGLEVCVTLGSLTPEAARQLKDAGVTAYNHNIDTSPEHYPNIVTTHTFEDRLQTLQAAGRAGMSLCSGGILGLGESVTDRLRMLEVLTNLETPPESVPLNCLQAIPGTPLAKNPPVDSFELIRLIATARIALPRSKVRLSAGRTNLSPEAQALCFFAGANSIFYGDKLLTAPNPQSSIDLELLTKLDLQPQEEPSGAASTC